MSEHKNYLRWPEDDKDPYWDVLGDGWNPGHTMSEEEWKLENSQLVCFRRGRIDYGRRIFWKYSGERVRFHDPLDRVAIGKRLVALATQGIDEGIHDYEVEPNE